MIRWGIIGLGNIAQRFLKGLSYSDGGYVVAGASKTPEKRTAFLTNHPQAKGYEVYEALLADPGVDAIYIALPHYMHKEWSIKAMEAGKAVLCEKPAALNPDEVREMIETAQRKKIFFMEALKTRFIPLMGEIKKDLAEGIIGDVVKMEASFCTPPTGGPVRPQRLAIHPRQRGALLDIGPYPLGFLLDMMEGIRVLNLGTELTVCEDADRHFTVNLAFLNGVMGIAHGGTAQEENRLGILTGTKGVMEIPVHYRPDHYVVTYPDGTKKEKRVEIRGDDFLGEIEEVQRCVEAGQIESTRMSHRHTLELAEVIHWAHREAGREVF